MHLSAFRQASSVPTTRILPVFLPLGTKKCGSSGLCYLLHARACGRAGAIGAWFARLPIYPPCVLEVSEPAFWAHIILQAGTSRFYGFFQHIPYGLHQLAGFGGGKIASWHGWSNASPKQGLTHINIAQPRHNLLVKQKRFDRHPPVLAGSQ